MSGSCRNAAFLLGCFSSACEQAFRKQRRACGSQRFVTFRHRVPAELPLPIAAGSESLPLAPNTRSTRSVPDLQVTGAFCNCSAKPQRLICPPAALKQQTLMWATRQKIVTGVTEKSCVRRLPSQPGSGGLPRSGRAHDSRGGGTVTKRWSLSLAELVFI